MIEEGKPLLGSLKLTREADSIGLPVFMGAGGNVMYVPEMDADFLISDFLIFTNSNKFKMDYHVPPEFSQIFYRCGDPTPIPYWFHGKCYFVSGSAEASDLDQIHGSAVQSTDVLRCLSQYLHDARAGVFRQEREQWVARDISAAYGDVFFETPVHSVYWVRRFVEAVKYARNVSQPPHRIDEELRRVGLEWIKRFATKTDISRMTSVVGSLVSSKSLSIERAGSAYFAFIMHRMQSGRFKEIERELPSNNEFAALFSYGIYTFYKEHDGSHTLFDYAKPYGILDPFYKELQIAHDTDDYTRLELMSYAYFNRADAPREVGDAIVPMLYTLNDNLLEARDELRHRISRKQKFEEEASELVSIYKSMQSLDGCVSGMYRLSKVIFNDRFGMDARFMRSIFSMVGQRYD
ncbi:hypothetical protein [Methylobacterium sp. WL9]|uniref:hypothetical protein n=1 Tax=Methylobacterium sp. WL9 TaxID=2603898 RepID=UPI0011CAF131|nr:hypothetical protein [Methylobacterium sp. WL9]TXN22150.1 hypothetical protein FV217_11795 [Methylobacterium sp. WL9]